MLQWLDQTLRPLRISSATKPLAEATSQAGTRTAMLRRLEVSRTARLITTQLRTARQRSEIQTWRAYQGPCHPLDLSPEMSDLAPGKPACLHGKVG